MLSPLKSLSTFLNPVRTITTEGKVEYKKEENSLFYNNEECFFELSIPDGLNTAGIKQLLITTCKKVETLTTGEYFKILTSQAEYFILSPFCDGDTLKVNLGNNGFEEKLKADCISRIKEEFNKQKEAMEKDFLRKIFETEKIEIDNSYPPDRLFKIHSEFESEYIKNGLTALRAEKDHDNIFKELIQSLNEKLIKEDVLKCVNSFFTKGALYELKILRYTKNEDDNETVEMVSSWQEPFAKVFSEILTFDKLNLIKKYILKNIKSLNLIDYETAKSITDDFKTALEKNYNAKADSLKIGNINVYEENIEFHTKIILRILISQYNYFYTLLIKVHAIVQSIKTAADDINKYDGGDIEEFKKLLDNYKTVSESEVIISSFIEDLQNKLDKVVEEDMTAYKPQLELFKADKKVLQFTLILDGSRYVYPGFYTLEEDVLNYIKDKAEEEVYKIITCQGIEGPQGPEGLKGARGSPGKDGAIGVSETISVQKTSFFFTWAYQIFLIFYLISLTGLVVNFFLMALNRQKLK